MIEKPTPSQDGDGVVYLVTDFDRLQGGMFTDRADAVAKAAQLAADFPGNTVHVLTTCETHRSGRTPHRIGTPAKKTVVPDDVVSKAMKVFRSLPHPTSMGSETEMRAVLQAVWPVAPATFRVAIETMREADKGDSWTVTLYHPARHAKASIFDSEGRMEIYHTYTKGNAEHTLAEWEEFLSLGAGAPPDPVDVR